MNEKNSNNMVFGNGKLGFDVMQVMMNAQSVWELDDCMRVVNNAYAILRERMVDLEQMQNQEAGMIV